MGVCSWCFGYLEIAPDVKRQATPDTTHLNTAMAFVRYLPMPGTCITIHHVYKDISKYEN